MSIRALIFLALFVVSAEPAIRGVCYSPFRDGQNPNGVGPSRAQVVEDLVLAKNILSQAPFTSNIRGFGIDKDYLRWIYETAESLSVCYMVGGWASLQYDTWAKARGDILGFLKKADSLDYKFMSGVMYGYNNVAETHYLYPTEDDKIKKVITEINECKKAFRPYPNSLTHEENWDVWLRHPELADSLAFISIRIVPQIDLVGLDSAFGYIKACYDTVCKTFPNKKVVITTVGWSTYNCPESWQKKFLTQLTADTSLNYYIFSLTDESWKWGEGYFGLLSTNRQPKLFLYNPLVINFSGLFVADSLRLDGFLYNHGCFGYDPSMSLTALQKKIGEWADTFNEISQYAFFSNADLGAANGTLADIFGENGNKLGIILNSYSPDANTAKALKTKKVKMVFPSINNFSPFVYYGRKDSLGKERTIDSIRHFMVFPIRQNYDSAFVGVHIDNYYLDSLLKYPEVIREFDGFFYKTAATNFAQIPKKDEYVDSLIAVFKAKIGSKKLIVMIDVRHVDSLANDKDIKESYNAFKKASKKYGFPLIIDGIEDFYESINITNKPTGTYKYLLPHRFGVSVISGSKVKMGDLLLSLAGRKLIINAPGEAVLSIYDLKGKRIGQVNINKKGFFDFKSAGLANGIWVAKVTAAGKQATLKVLIGR